MNSPNFGPIEKESVAEKVVRKITDMIKAGNLKAGDRIPSERELAELFQVSRPSLREALRALAILGVVEIQHGGGIFISNLDAETLLTPLDLCIMFDEGTTEDLFECRRTIEIEIAKKTADRIGDTALNKLESLIDTQLTQLNDPTGFRISDYEFHGIIFKAAENPIMSRIATIMHHMGIENRRRATEIPGLIKQSYQDHRAILDALKQHDRQLAAEAMKKHLDNIEKSTLQAIELLKNEQASRQ